MFYAMFCKDQHWFLCYFLCILMICIFWKLLIHNFANDPIPNKKLGAIESVMNYEL